MKRKSGYCVYCGLEMSKNEDRMCRDCDGDVCKWKKHAPKKKQQCLSTMSSAPRGGVVSSSFCIRNEHHPGNHRGFRAEWNKKGERVKITLPPDIR